MSSRPWINPPERATVIVKPKYGFGYYVEVAVVFALASAIWMAHLMSRTKKRKYDLREPY